MASLENVLRSSRDHGLPQKAQLRQLVNMLDKLSKVNVEGIDPDEVYHRKMALEEELQSLSSDNQVGVRTRKNVVMDRAPRRATSTTSNISRNHRRSDFVHPCVRCKSDLYNRLMVSCSSCNFRMHTYCFDPPILKKPDSEYWYCATCKAERTARESMTAATARTPYNVRTWSPPKLRPPKSRQAKPNTATATLITSVTKDEDNDEDEDTIVKATSAPYEWQTYCEKKLEALQSAEADKLVYYAKKRAVKRQAATAWDRFVSSRQDRARRIERIKTGLEHSLPEKRLGINMELSAEEASRIQRENREIARAAAEEKARQERAEAAENEAVLASLHSERPNTTSFAALAIVAQEEKEFEESLDLIEAQVEEEENNEEQPSSIMEMLAVSEKAPPESSIVFQSENDIIQKLLQEVETQPSPPLINTKERRPSSAETTASSVATVIENATQLFQEEEQVKAKQSVLDSLKKTDASTLNNNTLEVLKLTRKNAANRIQKYSRVFLIRKHTRVANERRNHAAATVINTACKTFIQNRRKVAREQSEAALKLQTILRGRKSRHATSVLRQQNKEQAASPIIHRFFIGTVAPYITHKKQATVKLQCQWRIKVAKSHTNKVRLQKQYEEQYKAATAMQCMLRRKQATARVSTLRNTKAALMLQKHIRGYQARKAVRIERTRVGILNAIVTLNEYAPQDMLASSTDLLLELAMHCYSNAQFSKAASVLERAAKNFNLVLTADTIIVLGYCHHNAWYATYDNVNLSLAMDAYNTGLSKYSDVRKDPFALLEIAIVKMQLRSYNTSLETLIHMLTAFPRFPEMPKVLFLIAVQMFLLKQYSHCVEYIIHLQTNLPFSYTKTDMMVFLSLAYIRCEEDHKKIGKEGLKSAYNIYRSTISHDAILSSPNEMLLVFANSAREKGHYALASKVYVTAIHKLKSSVHSSSWLQLADSFRHEGQHEKAVNAVSKALKLSTDDDDATLSYARSIDWKEPSTAFSTDLERLSDIEAIVLK